MSTNPEITDFNLSFFIYKNIWGFNVSMDHMKFCVKIM